MPANRIGGYIINDPTNGVMLLYYIATTTGKALTFENTGNTYAFQTTVDAANFNNPKVALGFDDGTQFILGETPTDNYGETLRFGNTTFIPSTN